MKFTEYWVNRWLTIGLAGCFALLLAAPAFGQRNTKPKPKPVKIRLPAAVREKSNVKMKVSPVLSGRRNQVKGIAASIDGIVESQLLKKSQTPNGLASDEVFLRRVYLDVAGRIPTLEEAEKFLRSEDSDKRENLIDELLNSPDYVSNMYNFWADTFRLVERPNNNVFLDPFLSYVKESIRLNKRYDKWVYEMLTASGKPWENPAVGFQLRDDGMPLPYVDNTVRVFLGTQIGCAQCHDHPFDHWTQYEFYGLAAFTNGTRTRIVRGDPGFEKTNPTNLLINEGRKRYDKGRIPGHIQRVIRANSYKVSQVDRAMRLPHDYAYDDHKPKDVVKPSVLWGEVPTSAREGDGRAKFAAWVTSPENPQFSKTLVNRVWKRMLGIALVEPVDDFSDDNPCSNEELMDYLSREFVRSDFNLKELTRMILYSDTYQREATDYSLTSGELYYFPGPVVRRMTAEQVWDSLLTMAVHNPWAFQRPHWSEFKPVVDLDFSVATFDTAKKTADRFAETLDSGAIRKEMGKLNYQRNYLIKASEQQAPLPADHFLRQFGQGDREVINGAQQDATVPQILAMFNGPITHVMLEPGSAIVDNVLGIDSVKDRVDAIFLSVLSRRPAPRDRVTAAKELSSQKNDNVGYGNIIWALLNTREFLFVQ